MRTELTLSMYSFENVVFHVLGKRLAYPVWISDIHELRHDTCRVPRYSDSTLTEWYKSSVSGHTSRVLRYMSDRTLLLLEMLEEAEVVTKTA
jgi:DNA polymerase zeta